MVDCVKAVKHVLSLRRLAEETTGLRTPDFYISVKLMAAKVHFDWKPMVASITPDAVLHRIKWCEMFMGDLLVLQNRLRLFEKRMLARGVDVTHPLGSREHEERKLRMLLEDGEDAVAAVDICEDVLMRSSRRLDTLIGWGYKASVRLHMELTDRRMRECDGLVMPERFLQKRAEQERRQHAVDEILSDVRSGTKSWGQVLLGEPLKPGLHTLSPNLPGQPLSQHRQ